MPRGRPTKESKLAAKQAEEAAKLAEEARQANMTQEEVEAEKQAEAEQQKAEEEAKKAQNDSAVEKRVTASMKARAEKAAKKAKKSALGIARFEAYRESVKNLPEEERKKRLASHKAKGMMTRKRIQGDLIFPVKTIKKNLKGYLGMKKVFKNSRDERVNVTLESAIFSAAVIEYLTAEVLELSGECSKDMKKTRIVPRHIMSAVRMDDELNKLFPRSLTIATAGVLPKPMPHFLAKNNVPRSQWTAGPSEIFRETAISAPSSRKSQASTKAPGKNEVNNNK